MQQTFCIEFFKLQVLKAQKNSPEYSNHNESRAMPQKAFCFALMSVI